MGGVKLRRALVIGAGPGGLASAIVLVRGGWDVTVLERRERIEQKICGECLSPPCREILQRIGVWERLAAGSVLDVSGITIRGVLGGECRLDFGADQAFTVPRVELDSALWAAAVAAGVRVEFGVAVDGVERDGSGYRARTSHGEFSGELLVGADGRRSPVAQRLGLAARRGHWLKRTAVMGHFRLPPGRAARVEMIVREWGYLGVNPLPGGFANVIAVLSPKELRKRSPVHSAMVALAQEAVPGIEPEGDKIWAASPLAWVPRGVVTESAALVGDSAGFVDPFTGEGLYHAFASAEALGLAVNGDGDLAESLRGYARWHRSAFGPEELFCSLLQRLLRFPRLSEYVLGRLRAKPELRARMALAVADRIPISEVLAPRFWARLLWPGEVTTA